MLLHYRNLDDNSVHDLVVEQRRVEHMIKVLEAKNCQVLGKYLLMGL